MESVTYRASQMARLVNCGASGRAIVDSIRVVQTEIDGTPTAVSSGFAEGGVHGPRRFGRPNTYGPLVPSQGRSKRRLAPGRDAYPIPLLPNGLHEMRAGRAPMFVPTGPPIQTPGVPAGKAAAPPSYRTAEPSDSPRHLAENATAGVPLICTLFEMQG